VLAEIAENLKNLLICELPFKGGCPVTALDVRKHQALIEIQHAFCVAVELQKARIAQIDGSKFFHQVITDILRIECAEDMERESEGIPQIPVQARILAELTKLSHIFSNRRDRRLCRDLQQAVIIRRD